MALLHTERIAMMKRAPVRISITLPYMTHKALDDRATFEGRSLSNLCAFLLQTTLEDPTTQPNQDRLTFRHHRSMV